jgi:hypothetical protein
MVGEENFFEKGFPRAPFKKFLGILWVWLGSLCVGCWLSDDFAIRMGHPDRANKGERRDLQKRKKRFWRCEHANHFKQNVTLCVWECNALA